MRAEISKLHKKLETTIIYVTHDQTEAMTMGDKIVVMKDGLIQQIDSPINVYNHPTINSLQVSSEARRSISLTAKSAKRVAIFNF